MCSSDLDLLEVSRKQTVDLIFTSMTTPLTQKKYSEYIQQLSLAFSEMQVFVTGYQTKEYPVELPGNVIRIESPEQFTEKLKLLHS